MRYVNGQRPSLPLIRLIFLFVSSNSFVAVASAPPVTLCSADETVAFSCALSAKKLVSLCASPGISRTSGYLQYRFGRRSRIELEYPDKTVRPEAAFSYTQFNFAKGGTSAIAFTVGAFRYSLFRTTSAFGYNGTGVIVDENGRRKAYLACDDRTVVTDSDIFYRLSGLGLPNAPGSASYIGPEE
jgi:hypothetical protein